MECEAMAEALKVATVNLSMGVGAISVAFAVWAMAKYVWCVPIWIREHDKGGNKP